MEELVLRAAAVTKPVMEPPRLHQATGRGLHGGDE